ncbi:MFS transporter [Kibdelosporangium persicum]|uniref:Major facilitator superfamily (MFS) profile domain-containing protein n=1 Tax=Kibdelosporangium persicum TaxID=2698649 RepID=A0ABX2FHZ6_9PSEU|nr:hypothetical protein [Kibdelosporangium persicum]
MNGRYDVVVVGGVPLAWGAALMVVPTYFMLVRGENALVAGLMVAPQGAGALLTMPVAGRFVDRVGPRKVVVPGLVLISASFPLLTQVGAHTPYWMLLMALFVTGLGIGMTMMPINSAAPQTLPPSLASRASTVLNIVLQTAGAIGAAVVSIILAGLLADRFGVPTDEGQLTATAALADPAPHEAAAVASWGKFASTFTWTLLVVLLLPAAGGLPAQAAGVAARPGLRRRRARPAVDGPGAHCNRDVHGEQGCDDQHDGRCVGAGRRAEP